MLTELGKDLGLVSDGTHRAWSVSVSTACGSVGALRRVAFAVTACAHACLLSCQVGLLGLRSWVNRLAASCTTKRASMISPWVSEVRQGMTMKP